MLFRQLFDSVSSTYTYVLASGPGREASIIDPVREKADDYVALIKAQNLKALCAVDTPTHANHVAGLGVLRHGTECTTVMGVRTQAEHVSRRTALPRLIAVSPNDGMN